MIAAPAPRRRPTRLASLLLPIALAGACSPGGSAPASTAEGSRSDAKAGAADPAAATPAPALPAAEDVLARAAAAMGSKEALARVQSFYYRGTIELVGQNIRGDLEIWWKGGDFYMEQHVPGLGRMRAGKRGQEVWADDPIHGLRQLSGVEAEQHVWASSLLLAAEWKRYFAQAKTLAVRTEGDRTIHEVELSSPSGLRVVMRFDAESGLQVGQSFEQVTPMGTQPFDVRFEDYREVEGIKLAYRQLIDAKVQRVVQEITEVRINAEVDEAKLAYPRTGADLVRQPAAEPAAGSGPSPG